MNSIIHSAITRLATAKDIPAMMALAAASEAAAQWTPEMYDRIFSSQGQRRLVLLVESAGKDAATCAPAAPLGFLVAVCPGPEWEIENLVVSGAARRRGLGTCLVRECLERALAAGADSVLLEVRPSNHAARVLYEKSGFRLSGRRRGYYANPPEDALLYRFDIALQRSTSAGPVTPG